MVSPSPPLQNLSVGAFCRAFLGHRPLGGRAGHIAGTGRCFFSGSIRRKACAPFLRLLRFSACFASEAPQLKSSESVTFPLPVRLEFFSSPGPSGFADTHVSGRAPGLRRSFALQSTAPCFFSFPLEGLGLLTPSQRFSIEPTSGGGGVLSFTTARATPPLPHGLRGPSPLLSPLALMVPPPPPPPVNFQV